MDQVYPKEDIDGVESGCKNAESAEEQTDDAISASYPIQVS